jgi:hypothetical protein
MAESEANSGAFRRLTVPLTAATLVVLTGAYFVVATSSLPPVLSQFVLNVIGNLIPVLLVILVSFTLLYQILRTQQEEEIEEIRKAVRELDRPRAAGVLDSGARLPAPTRLIVASVLKGVAASLAPPGRAPVLTRVFCHLADPRTRTLRPVYVSGPTSHQRDYDVKIPYEGDGSEPFVVVAAFRQKDVVARDLPEAHHEMYLPSLRGKISPSIRAVVAAPVSDFESGSDESPLGAISIDFTATLAELNLTEDSVEEVMVLAARAIYHALRGGG